MANYNVIVVAAFLVHIIGHSFVYFRVLLQSGIRGMLFAEEQEFIWPLARRRVCSNFERKDS